MKISVTLHFQVDAKVKSGPMFSLVSHHSQWNELGSSRDYYRTAELGTSSKLQEISLTGLTLTFFLPVVQKVGQNCHLRGGAVQFCHNFVLGAQKSVFHCMLVTKVSTVHPALHSSFTRSLHTAMPAVLIQRRKFHS